MDSKGRKLHEEANVAREHDQDFLKSLQLTDEALLAYAEDKDVTGFTEVIAERSITFRHLADQMSDNNFLDLAKAELAVSLEIAKQSGKNEAIMHPAFQLGKVAESLKDFASAVTYYKEALDNSLHVSSAARNNIKIALDYSEFRNGDKSAKNRMLVDIKDLERNPDHDNYNQHVWESGAYMNLAYMIKDDSPSEANEYLQKAKEIIDSDERLVLRKKQWDKLTETF